MRSEVAEIDAVKRASDPSSYQSYHTPWFACPVRSVLLCVA
jgi:hypothetical protein